MPRKKKPLELRNSRGVTAETYHPESIAYMKRQLGRTATPAEAEKLDQEWASIQIKSRASSKTVTPDIAAELMTSSPGATSGQKTLKSRQFKDYLDSAPEANVAYSTPLIITSDNYGKNS